MSNPRETYSWNGLHRRDTTYPPDGTIVAPVIGANGLVPSISAQVGLVCGLVNTGTAGPQVGIGAAGTQVLGQIKIVDPADGMVTVQDQGYAYVPYSTAGGLTPTPGNPVEADGTGKVRLSTAKFNAICIGFGTEPNATASAQDGLLRCIVKFN